MLKKDNFEWTNEVIIAFEDLKRAMTCTLVLALLDFEKPLMVYIDVSGDEIETILV